jgi:pyruvate/2-oxoglutarate dehydrogenase complex dihydrolipoamide dehydrogenase (E3) component
VWSYRWHEVQALGVPVKTGVNATAQSIRDHDPDLVIVATGARVRPCPFDTSRLDPRIRVVHAWEVLSAPERVRSDTSVTILGGGMVGIEAADLLTSRGVQCTVIEALATVAPGMARNNRTELIERVSARGTRIITGASVIGAAGGELDLEGSDGSTTRLAIGDFLIVAIGPVPDRDAVPLCEAAGVPYAIIGDAWQPGDFLSCLRDAWMTALSVDHQPITPHHSRL